MSKPKAASKVQETPATVAERRAWVRYPCQLESSCQPLGAARGLQWTGTIHDISRGGLALTVGRRFEVGTLLAIEVPHTNEQTSLTVLARVARVTPQPGTAWLIGCAFTHTISDEELQSLV
jgi:hypothetical protein